MSDMYRYLEKYTGTYRVLPHLDIETNDFPRDENGCIDDSFEDIYIPCSRGKAEIRHTYDEDKLVLCFFNTTQTARNVYKEIKDKYKNIEVEFEDLGDDGLIYFNADDIKKIATLVSPRTSGASTKWNSLKNLPKIQYDIPYKDAKKIADITEGMSKVDKMQFGRKTFAEFLEKNNLTEEQKQSRLTSKEFIHSKGLWEEYIELVKKEVKNYGN